MATVSLTKKGYGQLELNQVAFRRDGRIEAQCKLDEDLFPAGSNKIGEVAENGMLLSVDNVNRKLTTDYSGAEGLIGLHYSAEHMYDPLHTLKDFYLSGDDVLPRVGYLAVGDKFTTNTVCYNSEEFADEDALKTAIDDQSTDAVYATVDSGGSGYWFITKTATGSPKARVLKWTTMPDGQPGLKLQVLEA